MSPSTRTPVLLKAAFGYPPVNLPRVQAEAERLVDSVIAQNPADPRSRFRACSKLWVTADSTTRHERRLMAQALSLFVHDKAAGVPEAIGVSAEHLRKEVLKAMWLTSHGPGIGADLDAALKRVRYYPAAESELPALAQKVLLARAVAALTSEMTSALWLELSSEGMTRMDVARMTNEPFDLEASIEDRLTYRPGETLH